MIDFEPRRTMQSIILDRLRLKASIGILEHERNAKQAVIVTIKVEVDEHLARPARDDIGSVFDYRHLRDAALEQARSGHVNMLETFADRICRRLLQHEAILMAQVTVTKPDVFSDCDGASVQLTARKENP